MSETEYGSIMHINDYFYINHIYNYGSAFNFLSDQLWWQKILLSVISIIVSLGLIRWIYKTDVRNSLKLVSISVLLGGAIGNLVDRVMNGYVVDFIALNYMGYYAPIFNIADVAISIGIMMLILEEVKFKKNNTT